MSCQQYGQSTHDPDKSFPLQFYVTARNGDYLHYELSYKALSGFNHMVGSPTSRSNCSGKRALFKQSRMISHQDTGSPGHGRRVGEVVHGVAIRKYMRSSQYLTP
jgi:hypothetical protein